MIDKKQMLVQIDGKNVGKINIKEGLKTKNIKQFVVVDDKLINIITDGDR